MECRELNPPEYYQKDAHACIVCEDYYHELDEGICSHECKEHLESELSHAIMCQFEEINWKMEKHLDIAQMLYNKAKYWGLNDLAHEIVIDSKIFNVNIDTNDSN